MKICWDNLEGFRLNRTGNFQKGHIVYIWIPSCKKCGEPYLTERYRQSNFCSRSCALSGENNPGFGRVCTVEEKKRLLMYSFVNNVGPLHYNYKGGVTNAGLVTYDGYKDKLSQYETIRKQMNTEVLEIKCVYCGQWFCPTRVSVDNRIAAINSLTRGEARLYCSEDCKQDCPTYGQKKWSKGHKPRKVNESIWYTDAELRIWREEVLKRENYICEYCGEKATIAHHIKPKKLEPFFALDPAYGVACCEECHYKYGHQGECNTANLAHIDCK